MKDPLYWRFWWHTLPFLFLRPWFGLDTQRGNRPLSWYSQIFFWLLRCGYHLVQTAKLQQDIQVDVLITLFDLCVFPNIATTTIFHAHRWELIKSPVNFPFQKVFWVEPPWQIDGGVTTARSFVLIITYVKINCEI